MKFIRTTLHPDEFIDCDEIAKVNYFDDFSAIEIQIYWDKNLDRIIVCDDGHYLSMNGSFTLRQVILGLGYKCGDIQVDQWYNGEDWVKNDSILDRLVSNAPLCYISVHPFHIDYSDEE